MDGQIAPFVRLFTTLDQFEAKVAAAKLGAEGIVSELRGAVSSAYPLGPVHVFVEADRLDEAREILTVVDDARPSPVRPSPRRSATVVIAALGLLVVLGFEIARLVMAR
jgi:Putative prokaryotic signal transducing protein